MKKKILSLLVLLTAAVSGAWADAFSTDPYTANATLSGVTVTSDMEITINENVTVTVNNGLNIASGATLIVKGPGTLVVNGTTGASGNNAEDGEEGGTAINGNIAVYGATVQATGGNGGNGGNSDETPGGWGGNAGAAFSGAVTIYSGKIIAQGAVGGLGGNSTEGPAGQGYSSAAFSGTLTFYGGTVEATSGDDFAYAFANASNLTFKTTEATMYSDAGHTDVITSVSNQQKVYITAPDVECFMLTVDKDNNKHGIITFTVGEDEENSKLALEGDSVTVKMNIDDPWLLDSIAAETYTNWESAGARRTPGVYPEVPFLGNIELTPLTNVEGADTAWYFKMPSASVLLSAYYVTKAQFTTAPAAAEGVVAGADKNLVTPGVVALVEVGEGPQGDVKYLATTEQLSAEQVAAATGWSADVPNAKDYTGDYAEDFTVYVWYYIDAVEGYLNSDTSYVEVTVKKNLYNVYLKPSRFNNITVEVNAIDKTADLIHNEDENVDTLKAVKYNQEIILKAQQGYKFRKVEVKKNIVIKSLTIPDIDLGCGDQVIYYVEGETWQQAIDNHAEANSGWSYNGYGQVLFSGYILSNKNDLANKDELISSDGGFQFKD